ncbi:lytic transglycosylase domain-containing protein [Sinorhizobium meliloti]|uniref:Transglycosylase SLT domain-containing protein n=1 Tax=Rhizobium meliloti TaxID=382 RepID=A0AAW9TJ41_RHIML|nr:lytic transglycosylase domain-containing protein [Sinorhizobium meliloti]AEG57425.1 Lytic transglycosylase catalytic [Sinorhizobium meliloti AK83]MDE4586880.1 lytic transglycosylase domain-containing protein [Sinorhizobium meliloti]MDE4605438.1 lytic transglycosylase domain-containing protein [Sinorhizobium meliloti]MQW32050.1 transglycosylase SLT domain-containing protein [Sinorhizobium meliloti]MQW34036.1 transglycosylase SLT domain-containing protein [Sinorhizobium meliloti]
MPVAFLDLAQTCAPIVAAETLAGVASLESRFEPFAIRINSGVPLSEQPATKAEAIAMATSLAAERQDIQLGLGGIGMGELRRLKLSISDAFDPCLNLQATATLLDGYYRLAMKAGADPDHAEQVMLQSYYGRDDPSVGAMVQYDQQVRQEVKRLGKSLAALMIGDGEQGRGITEDSPVDVAAEKPPGDERASVPSWDVFSSRRRSSVLVFQNSQMEQSE